ncbi:MAG: DUF2059 domain-containing protein [Spirochaetes bacterium]|nr:DUF2059 domain-containing protein [Spirochaetota bacterium]
MKRKSLFFFLFLFISLSMTGFLQAEKKNAKQSDIKELLILTGSDKIGIQMLNQIIDNFRVSMPDVPAEYWDSFLEKVNKEALIELIIPVYDKHLTHEDIKELIKFYKSPLGKKLISVMPIITQESYSAGYEWGKKLAEQVMEELKEKGYE